jgi:hypothetical protein
VNEDDERLETFITEEKDQRCVLVIEGVKIFLPINRGEASIEIQHVDTIMKEEE